MSEQGSLEDLLQQETRTPVLPAESRERILDRAGAVLRRMPKNSDDYTWPQFLLRFAAMAAVFCITIFFTELTLSDQSPNSDQASQPLPQLVEEQRQYLSPLHIAVMQRKQQHHDKRWIDYHRKGILP